MGAHLLDHHLLLEHMRATLRYAIVTCGHDRGHVASSIGISRATLKRFLDGGELSFPAYGRVLTWCGRYGWQPAAPEQAALSLLVSTYPLEQRQQAREAIVRWMRFGHVKKKRRVPEWLRDETQTWPRKRRRRRRSEA